VKALALALLGVVLAVPAAGHDPPKEELVLPVMGAAPDFRLTGQDGRAVALRDFHGRALVVSFIYTACPDYCPLLTAKLVGVQEALGDAFGKEVAFVSITVDPGLDTPEVLEHYALSHGADLDGWHFLTGEPETIEAVTRAYGVFAMKASNDLVDHTFLTSLVDTEGRLRVQYLGYRFAPEAFMADLLGLVGGGLVGGP
jgi:protein SCO1